MGRTSWSLLMATYRVRPSGATASAVGMGPTVIGLLGWPAGMAIGVTVLARVMANRVWPSGVTASALG